MVKITFIVHHQYHHLSRRGQVWNEIENVYLVLICGLHNDISKTVVL